MKIEIRNRFSGGILFSCEAGSMKLAVKAAIEAKANLSDADLSRADLSDADLSGADLSWADLSDADLSGADLSVADLSGADLSRANLKWADLSGANLDYSCWPLFCGSKKIKIDAKIAAQLAAHFCAVECDDKEYQKARKAILKFAMTSHRARDLELK